MMLSSGSRKNGCGGASRADRLVPRIGTPWRPFRMARVEGEGGRERERDAADRAGTVHRHSVHGPGPQRQQRRTNAKPTRARGRSQGNFRCHGRTTRLAIWLNKRMRRRGTDLTQDTAPQAPLISIGSTTRQLDDGGESLALPTPAQACKAGAACSCRHGRRGCGPVHGQARSWGQVTGKPGAKFRPGCWGHRFSSGTSGPGRAEDVEKTLRLHPSATPTRRPRGDQTLPST